MICSISGNTPEEPVVSIKTGNVYEKRLIEKYIETNGKEPTTGEPMNLNDLVTVKVGKVVKPRPTTATSIPSMLQLFQNEWDSLMLETFTLKQQYETIRQELAHSLYQYDAACRVIARLVKERDIARNALANARHNGTTTSNNNNNMDIDSNSTDSLPTNVQESIQENTKKLFASRKKRAIPTTLPKVEDLAEYSVTTSVPVHSSTKPGILCVDIHKQNSDLIATGGNDQNVNVFNKSTQKIESTLQGHHKKVNRVKFHPTNDTIFSCSSDKTVKVWNKSGDDYQSTYTFKNHQDEVTDISVHPLGSYLMSVSLDKSWNFYDVNAGQLLLSVRPTNVMISSYTCGSFHPDGSLLATGNTNKELSIWDINSKALVANLTGTFNSAISSMAFSENGYYLAAADQNTVQLWDLRKQNHLQTIDLGNNNVIKSISFDNSGTYLGIVGTDIQLCNVKGREQPLHLISAFSSHNQHSDLITDICWSHDSSYFATTSLDRSLKVWSK